MDPNSSDVDKLRLEHIKIISCCFACLTRGTNFSVKQDHLLDLRHEKPFVSQYSTVV
jgi:hypothetical protein